MSSVQELIENVASGYSAKDQVKAITEAMDMYGASYRIEDLQNSVSRNAADARSLYMKCKAYMAAMKSNGDMMKTYKALESAYKSLEKAEEQLVAAMKSAEDYKKKGSEPKGY